MSQVRHRKVHVIGFYLYIKFKSRQDKSIVTEIRIAVAIGDGIFARGQEWGFWGTGSVPFVENTITSFMILCVWYIITVFNSTMEIVHVLSTKTWVLKKKDVAKTDSWLNRPFC